MSTNTTISMKWLLSAALLAAMLTGCGSTTSRTALSANCTQPPSGNLAKTPVVAVLTETGAQTASNSQLRQADLETVVTGATKLSSGFMLNAIGNGIDAPNLAVHTQLKPEGPNELLAQQNLKCKRTKIEEAFGKLTTGGAPKSLDVISALNALHADLEGTQHGPVYVVLLSSMMQQTKSLNLRDPKVLNDPVGSINGLTKRGLSFRCDGWRVMSIGGSTDRGKPVADTTDRALKSYWADYFKRCGGALVSYNSRLQAFPVAGTQLATADYRTIPVAFVKRRDTVVATIDNNVLFQVGSAALLGGSTKQLRKLLPTLESSKGRIEVDGHTDATGSEELNRKLSRARADAVAKWIGYQAHVTTGRLKVRGYGAAQPVAPNTDEQSRARNRRVVITVHRR